MSVLRDVKIPQTQVAAVIPRAGAGLEIRTSHPVTQPDALKPGECLVRIAHTGVCHTDLHAAIADWPVPSEIPLVGGHEGVGEVVAIGKYTPDSPIQLGDRVGIKWMAYSCLHCEFCRRGLEMNCVNVKLSGYTVDGTFQQYAVSYVHHAMPIPKALDSAAAASILCAGVTVFKALKQSNTIAGNFVALPGAGGGLGHLAVQYARTMGLRVIAIDTGEDKRDLCHSLGAEAWIDFKESKDLVGDIQRAAGGHGPHAAIITAANSSAYQQAVAYLRPGGTLVAVGMPNAEMGNNVFWTVFKSIRIQGSYVGNRQDTIEALELAAAGKVKVHFESRKLEDLKDVYEGLQEGRIAGRIVLDV